MSEPIAEAEVADPLNWFVPSADPLDAYQDPRASLSWATVKELVKIPSPMNFMFQVQSAVFMAGVTGLTRLLLLFHHTELRHADRFRRHVRDRDTSRPLITVSNHQSALDDPITFAILGFKEGFIWPTNQRWTVGAAELCFANSFIGFLCKLGKVLPIVRGQGIWQTMMDDAVARLSAPGPDNWVHIYPEARVWQSSGGDLRRFKWGVGRLVADPEVTPIVVPIFIEGSKLILDERRTNRWGFSSYKGANIIVKVGEPIDFAELVAQAKEEAAKSGTCDRVKTYRTITEIIQKKVEELRDDPSL